MIATHLWAAALALPAFTQEPDDFVGRWAGSISTVDLEVEVNLAHEGGVWSGLGRLDLDACGLIRRTANPRVDPLEHVRGPGGIPALVVG